VECGGVGVDITVAFIAPKDVVVGEGRKMMEELAKMVFSTVFSSVSSTMSCRPNEEDRADYANLDL